MWISEQSKYSRASETLENLGADLIGIRKRMKISQRELASRIGLSYSTISRWETVANHGGVYNAYMRETLMILNWVHNNREQWLK